MGDFVKVAETKDIQTSNMIAVEVDGEKVCVAMREEPTYEVKIEDNNTILVRKRD